MAVSETTTVSARPELGSVIRGQLATGHPGEVLPAELRCPTGQTGTDGMRAPDRNRAAASNRA